MAEVTLSAAMRSNLLSLQNTASMMASTQQRLATGKKVNSALDNPNSYFSAQSLSNRASDLSNLLDGMGQGIQAIQAANQGITGALSIVSQMQAVATSAQQALTTTNAAVSTSFSTTNAGQKVANGATKLTDVAATAASTSAGFVAGDTLTMSVTSSTGATARSYTFTANANSTLSDLTNWVATVDTAVGGTGVISATVSSTGSVSVSVSSAASGAGAGKLTSTASVSFGSSTGTATGSSNRLVSLFAAKAATDTSAATAVSAYTESAATVVTTTSSLNVLGQNSVPTTSTTLNSLGVGTSDTLTVKVGNSTTSIAYSTGMTMSDLVTQLNSISGVSASLNMLNNTSGTATASQLVITSTSGQSLTLGGSMATDLSISTTAVTATAAAPSSTYKSQFDTLKTQLDNLIADSSYQGINLISSTANQPLKITFNEKANNPNQLVINSVDLTSSGLAVSGANGVWNSSADLTNALSQLTAAQTTLRNTASSLGQNLATVQTRQTFTTNLVNTLQNGSGQLTNADMNQESANMLALQTQQQLGTSSLSLASQASQAVLKLFP